MRRDLVIGSGNHDKAAELRLLLDGLPWTVKTLADYPEVREPEETGATFEANALLKARYYSEEFGVPSVADDSGLEVDALDGAPGVYSARYAGPGCTYDDNNRKLLNALADVPEDQRTARFVCCAAFVTPEGEEHVLRGTVEGVVAPECRGSNGFGYDPLFIANGYEHTFGEIAAEEKHKVSHRGRAFRALSEYLAQRAAAT